MDLDAVFPSADCEPGANDADLDRLEQAAGAPLPADYRSILKHTNGFNGFVGGDEELYLRLFDAEDVEDQLDTFDALESFPDHLAIADTGASWFFALDLGPDGPRYRELDAASTDVLAEMGTTFAEFLDAFVSRDA
jgi:SMI1 / KNR4 family (SUKH-1)